MRSQRSGTLPQVVGNSVLGDDAVEASVCVIQGEGDPGGGSGHVPMSLAVYAFSPSTYYTREFCCFTPCVVLSIGRASVVSQVAFEIVG